MGARLILWAALALMAAPAAAQPAAAPAAASAAPAGPPPIAALAAPPYLTNPVLSPDGHMIAAQVTIRGQDMIGIWDLRTSLDTPPRTLPQVHYDVRWMRWAGSARLLIGIQVTGRIMGMEVPYTRIVSLDIATWNATPLETGHGLLGDDVIFIDPAGTYALVTSQPSIDRYPVVLRVDLATGVATTIQNGREGIWDWFADGNGVVRAGVDYSNDRIKIYYRSGPGQELRRIESRRYPQDGSVIDMIRFVADADRGIVVTNAVTGRFGVYEYDFATDTRGNAIFEHPEVDAVAAVMGDNGRVDGVAYEDDRRRIRWLNPDLQRVQANIDRALPGKDNLILNRSSDGNRVLLFSSAADDPGTYYVYDRATRRIEGFAGPYDGLANRRFAVVRPIRFHNRDGTELPGYLTLPPDRSERNLPLILMPHGGPFARDSWSFDPWVQFLAARGYAVLQVNFRGSTGYGRANVERGFGQFGSGMIDDLEDGVDWLAQQGMIDPHRVCVMGASYGGYAALWAPIRHPDRYRCAISFAGVTDVRAMLRYDNRLFVAPRYSREWRRRIEGEARADLSLISPLQQAARLSLPVLIAHGGHDRTVPIAQSRDLVRALTRAGTNHHVESVFYPEEAHGLSKPEDSIDFLTRVEAFLAQHNPADPAPVAAPATTAAR
jgi:dipeptidyl aminopeptidase/acylaminoacyl peptidase